MYRTIERHTKRSPDWRRHEEYKARRVKDIEGHSIWHEEGSDCFRIPRGRAAWRPGPRGWTGWSNTPEGKATHPLRPSPVLLPHTVAVPKPRGTSSRIEFTELPLRPIIIEDAQKIGAGS